MWYCPSGGNVLIIEVSDIQVSCLAILTGILRHRFSLIFPLAKTPPSPHSNGGFNSTASWVSTYGEIPTGLVDYRTPMISRMLH